MGPSPVSSVLSCVCRTDYWDYINNIGWSVPRLACAEEHTQTLATGQNKLHNSSFVESLTELNQLLNSSSCREWGSFRSANSAKTLFRSEHRSKYRCSRQVRVSHKRRDKNLYHYLIIIGAIIMRPAATLTERPTERLTDRPKDRPTDWPNERPTDRRA